MKYSTRCPNCGRSLKPFSGTWECAPWICDNCFRGFWAVELTAEARSRYRAPFHDWGLDGAWNEKFRANREWERQQARIRGTSTIEEHFALLSSREMDALAKRRLSPEFAQKLALARRVRGA